MRYLLMKLSSPDAAGTLRGMLSWFAFLSVDRPIGSSTAIAKTSGMLVGQVAPD